MSAADDRRRLPRGERRARRAAARARARGRLDDGLVGARPRSRRARDATRSARGRARSCRSSTSALEPPRARRRRRRAVRRRHRVRAGRRRRARRGSRRAQASGSRSPRTPPGSEVSHGITRARPRSRARLTTFVEGGPLVVDRPRVDGTRAAAPRRARDGLGDRARLDGAGAATAAALGIVDAVHVTHLGKVGGDLRRQPRSARGCARSSRREASTDWGPLQETLATWRPWQRRPPWARRDRAPGAAEPRRADDAARRPLVLARGRPRDRGAPSLPGLPRLRPGAADRPRPERRVADRARPVRAVRRGGLRRPVHELRHPGGEPASARAPRRPARLGLRRPPPGRDRPRRSSASRACAATTRPSRRHFRARLAVGVAGEPPPAYAPHQQLRLDAAGRRARARPGDALGRAPVDRGHAGGERRAAPLPVDVVVALDPRRARAAVPRRRCSRFVGRLEPGGGRTVERHHARRGRPAARVAATDTIDALRPADPRAARARRGVEPLRLAAHGVRLRRGRGRHAVAHALGRRLARVLLQRRPVPLRAARRASRSPPSSAAGTLPIDRRRLRRRRAAERDDVRAEDRGRPRRARRGRRSRSSTGGSRTRTPWPAYFPRLLEAYGGDRAMIAHVRGRPRSACV